MKSYFVAVFDAVALDNKVGMFSAKTQSEALVRSKFIDFEDVLPVDVSYIAEDMVAAMDFEDVKYFLQENADIHVTVKEVEN